jgi:hypothetical protein
MISNEAMYLGTTPDVLIREIWIFHGQFLQIAFLLRGGTPRITNAALNFRP